MVERQSVPWDARLKKLVLTDKGREINELMLEDFSVVEETLSKGFSEQELEQFFDYIHRCLLYTSKIYDIFFQPWNLIKE